jgi:hypothetical protein
MAGKDDATQGFPFSLLIPLTKLLINSEIYHMVITANIHVQYTMTLVLTKELNMKQVCAKLVQKNCRLNN